MIICPTCKGIGLLNASLDMKCLNCGWPLGSHAGGDNACPDPRNEHHLGSKGETFRRPAITRPEGAP